MNFELRDKKFLKLVFVLVPAALILIVAIIFSAGAVWSHWDYALLDRFYRLSVASGHGPSTSPRIAYLLYTDDSYRYFKKNIMDRADLAGINQALSTLEPEAVVYDIIFARESEAHADRAFMQSIRELKTVYLPIGLDYSTVPTPFKWEVGTAYDRFRREYLKTPIQKNTPRPYFAGRALMQVDLFAATAKNSGHISAFADADGVYRHAIMLIRVEDRYFPTLALAMFLDYAGVAFEAIRVDWGNRITIPATTGSLLKRDVVIPIDNRGRTFIPFADTWENDFKKMEAHAFVKHFEDISLHGNLADFFEGRFVFVGDVSTGTSDLGQTPLEPDVPLIALHTALLNGMLTGSFYESWHGGPVLGVILFMGVLLGTLALLKSAWFLYSGGALCLFGVAGLTWFQMTALKLFPVVTVGVSTLAILVTLIGGLQIAVSKDRTFIKNAFSRYIPQKIVDELIARPELLKLGGEERVITMLFSDLADFTALSETMPPARLVKLLNAYLTEMTDIILEQGGIVDKYEGDAIMAEFGAPIPLPDHADRAVFTGLKMLRRLDELCREWAEDGFPEISCRIGINTGPVIVGNMGSNQVFDYTVIGDAVNLASRLEGANKRYRTRLMISKFTHDRLTPGRFKTRELDIIKVKGKSKPVTVYEVVSEASETLLPDQEAYYRLYEEAFAAYRNRDFARALAAFEKALTHRKDDPAALGMIARIHAIDSGTLPPDWDGSIVLTDK